jgi:hypothetical protein
MIATSAGDNAWSLKPRIGLGDVRFSMSRNDVAALDNVLGPAYTQHAGDDLKDELQSTFAQFKEFFSQDDLNAALGASADATGARGDVLTEYRKSGLIFEYENGHLVDMFADGKAERLHIGGVRVFSSDPLDTIRKLKAKLNEDPIILDNEVVFEHNFVYLFNFAKMKAKGSAEYVPGDSEQRSVTWRSSPRNCGTDLTTYSKMTL